MYPGVDVEKNKCFAQHLKMYLNYCLITVIVIVSICHCNLSILSAHFNSGVCTTVVIINNITNYITYANKTLKLIKISLELAIYWIEIHWNCLEFLIIYFLQKSHDHLKSLAL